MMVDRPSRAMERLGGFLRQHTGQTLTESRRIQIETSLRPLLRARGLASLDALVHALDRDPAGPLMAQAVDAMLNHESSFFRDFTVFQTIEQVLLPRLAARARNRTLRIWCAGCSTGQEAYSLAMLVRRMPLLEGWRIIIEASDVSALAIQKAQRGCYAQMDMQRGLPIGDLLRWFGPADGGWQIAEEIRAMISFKTANLLDTRPVTATFDLILCRNVLLYFPPALRHRLCENIARQAHVGSYLVLGAGELLAEGCGTFSASGERSGIYVADKPSQPANGAGDTQSLPPSAALG